MAIKSIIKKNIKKIEISKNDFLKFSQNDLNNELSRLANRINLDVETLKNGIIYIALLYVFLFL